MDWPLRTRLLAAFVGVVGVSAALTVPAGTILINRMVLREAQRRVDLALKTADDMLKRRLEDARQASSVIAEVVSPGVNTGQPIDPRPLEDARRRRGYDFLHIVDSEGRVIASARGRAEGTSVAESAVTAEALRSREPEADIAIMPLESLELEDSALAAQARIRVLATPRAKPGGPDE